MGLQLRTETVIVSNSPLCVTEENWDTAIRLQIIEKESEEKPAGDPRKQYFMKNFFRLMSACTTGENVPDIDRALEILAESPGEIDNWYMAVSRVNPHWFMEQFSRPARKTAVEMRDGSTIEVVEVRTPSAFMRLYDLEQDALTSPSDDISVQLFRQAFYPKLAASTSGQMMSAEDARNLPASELDKWYQATRALNPGLFETIEKIADNAKSEEKKRKKHRK